MKCKANEVLTWELYWKPRMSSVQITELGKKKKERW